MKIETLSLSPLHSNFANKIHNKQEQGQSFGKILSDAIGNVNSLQKDAEQASLQLAAGKINDISQVTIATEKASLALQLTMQVRNKIIDAYQDVMRMQV